MAYLATSADLIGRAYRFLHEPSASPQKFPSAEVVNYLDEAHPFVTAELGLLVSTAYNTTSAGVGLYLAPSAYFDVHFVLVLKDNPSTSSDYKLLKPMGITEAAINTTYLLSGEPQGWTNYGTSGGQMMVSLIPIPDLSAVSGIVIGGFLTPDPIATTFSPIPRNLLPLLPLRAAMLAWEDRGNLEEYTRLEALFKKRIEEWDRFTSRDAHTKETDINTFLEAGDVYPYRSIGQGQQRGFNPLGV